LEDASVRSRLDSRSAIALYHIPEKPNPLTPFPAREGGTRTPAPLSYEERGWGRGHPQSTFLHLLNG